MNPHQKPQEDVVGLLPCPFCGDGKPWLYRPALGRIWHVHCEQCEVMGQGAPNREDAIAAWNTRAAPTYEAGRRDMREAAGWQPIEIAPKDGTKIDLWVAWTEGIRLAGRVTDCWWGLQSGGGFGDFENETIKNWVREEYDASATPYVGYVTGNWEGVITHWRALPTEPLGGEKPE